MSNDDAMSAALAKFGIESLRAFQARAVSAALAKRDTLIRAATGSGKSLCYQLLSVHARGGLVIVVSPLIALMRDQVTSLVRVGVRAVALASDRECSGEMAAVESGQCRLVYVSAERAVLAVEWLAQLHARHGVALLAIDECHCVSEYGGQFRPAYRQLGQVRERLSGVPVMALSASISEPMEAEIVDSLRLRRDSLRVIKSSLERANLRFAVHRKQTAQRDLEELLRSGAFASGGALIYCWKRAETEELSKILLALGVRAHAYHAGLLPRERERVLQEFVCDAPTLDVVVATVAFGMGIDKRNVRSVVHYGAPKSLEQYYQEAGRAGRDGEPAQCLLFYQPGDFQAASFMINQGQAGSDEMVRQRKMIGDIERYCVAVGVCRRRMLLAHFGETLAIDGACAGCDACENKVDERVDLSAQAYLLLSTTIDTGAFYGRNYPIEVLRGASNSKLIQRNGHRSVWYKRGARYSSEWWKHVSRLLSQHGYLESVARQRYTSVQVSEQGRRWLAEHDEGRAAPIALEATPTLLREVGLDGLHITETKQSVASRTIKSSTPKFEAHKKKKRKRASFTSVDARQLYTFNALDPIQRDVFGALVRARMKLGRELSKPPHLLFNEDLIRKCCVFRPKTLEHFEKVCGAQQHKHAKFIVDTIVCELKRKGIKENEIQIEADEEKEMEKVNEQKKRFVKKEEAKHKEETKQEISLFAAYAAYYNERRQNFQ